VNVPTGQLLYLGNRASDAMGAMADKHCEVFYSATPLSVIKRLRSKRP
jgi:hypothetical protein